VCQCVSWHQRLHQLAVSDPNNHGSGADEQMPQTEESSTSERFSGNTTTDQANRGIFVIPAYLIDLSRRGAVHHNAPNALQNPAQD